MSWTPYLLLLGVGIGVGVGVIYGLVSVRSNAPQAVLHSPQCSELFAANPGL